MSSPYSWRSFVESSFSYLLRAFVLHVLMSRLKDSVFWRVNIDKRIMHSLYEEYYTNFNDQLHCGPISQVVKG